jgi:hypothetical protein
MERKKSPSRNAQPKITSVIFIVRITNFCYRVRMAGIGRPTSFRPEMCEQAHNYCLLGATNDELAEFLAVCPRTIDNWIVRHPDFAAAVRSGRVVADARVARGLYDRAVGYDRKVEREIVVAGELKSVASTVHYPPNVQACIFWLRNRRPRTWGDAPDDLPKDIDDIALLDAAGESVRHHDGD